MIYSNLLIRSFRQANASFDAMESRCFESEISFLERKKPITAKHLTIAILILCLVANIAIWGERVAVLGNNGAGKSTFFLCCNGVLKPTSGDISLHGQKVGKASADRFLLRRSVGLVFQDPEAQLVAGTVEAEISFGPMNLKLSAEEVDRRVERSIFALNLETLRQRSPHTLSGGEKKRVTFEGHSR